MTAVGIMSMEGKGQSKPLLPESMLYPPPLSGFKFQLSAFPPCPHILKSGAVGSRATQPTGGCPKDAVTGR